MDVHEVDNRGGLKGNQGLCIVNSSPFVEECTFLYLFPEFLFNLFLQLSASDGGFDNHNYCVFFVVSNVNFHFGLGLPCIEIDLHKEESINIYFYSVIHRDNKILSYVLSERFSRPSIERESVIGISTLLIMIFLT